MADEDVEISETGLWIDDATGKLTKKQPGGGATQLVRPGGRVTEAVKARIASIEEPDVEPSVVTSEATPAKPKKAAPAKRAAKKK